MQRLRPYDPGRFSSRSALPSYGHFAPLALWRLCLFTTSVSGPGELHGLWGSMVFYHAPIPRKGSGNQQQKDETLLMAVRVVRSYLTTVILLYS